MAGFSANTPQRPRQRARHSAFTLIELLVVIAIIAVLIALLVPAVQKVREAAGRSQCQNNLHQIAVAVHAYHDVNKKLPPGAIAGAGEGTWSVLILPYLERTDLSNQWDLTLSNTFYRVPAAVRQAQVSVYYCPTRRAPTTLSTGDTRAPWGGGPGACGDYAVSIHHTAAGTHPTTGATLDCTNGAVGWSCGYGALPYAAQRTTIYVAPANTVVAQWYSRTGLRDILDGTSETFLIGEKHVPPTAFGDLGNGGDNSIYNGDNTQTIARAAGPSHPLARFPTDTYNHQFGSYHSGICQFAFCDGSVRPIGVATPGTTLQLLTLRNDDTPVPAYDR